MYGLPQWQCVKTSFPVSKRNYDIKGKGFEVLWIVWYLQQLAHSWKYNMFYITDTSKISNVT